MLRAWLWPAILLAVFSAGCGPAPAEVVGDYRLEGDPARPHLVWTLSPGGAFTARDGRALISGTWQYERHAFTGGHLRVKTEYFTHEYAVTKVTGTLEILVDPDQRIRFLKQTTAVPPAK
jgi:hypothetical protein